MRPRAAGFAAAAAGIALTALAFALTAPALAQDGVERAADAVVAITSGRDRIGSGVVVARGYVLTAAHVAEDAAVTEGRVLEEGSLHAFEVVELDEGRDLALLQVTDIGARPIEWGASRTLVRGQDVIVLGYPIGLRQVSLTRGVVSSPMQSFEGDRFVQVDAAINPGNSGGALVDSQGRLVGINVAKIADVTVESVGFAVPGDEAYAFVRDAVPQARLDRALPGAEGDLTSTLLVIAAFVGLVAVVAWGVAVRFARPRVAPEAAPVGAGGPSEPSAAPAPAPQPRHPVRAFRLEGPSRHGVITVRMPAVVGHAANADIRIQEEDIEPYHLRLEVADGNAVRAVSLVVDGGIFCGEACVLEAMLRPGESVRIGRETVTYVGEGEG